MAGLEIQPDLVRAELGVFLPRGQMTWGRQSKSFEVKVTPSKYI